MANKIRTEVREELVNEMNFKPYSEEYEEYKYYVSDLSDNLFGIEMSTEHKRMFEEGSGSELKDSIDHPAKAKAIDSSSILSYNFFRNISEKCTVVFDGIRYNKVLFEVKLRTLKKSPTPANLDVALISEDEKTILFIESKFLEYLETGNANFSKSYLREDSYYDDNEEKKGLIKMSSSFKDEKGRYNSGIKQNICHLIGISNLKKSEDARMLFKKTYKDFSDTDIILNAESYKFLNIIFRPRNQEAAKECDKYIEQLKEFQNTLPAAIKEYTIPTFVMTYRELFNILPSELSLKEELEKRYIKHHA